MTIVLGRSATCEVTCTQCFCTIYYHNLYALLVGNQTQAKILKNFIVLRPRLYGLFLTIFLTLKG